jgi:hypothetical protein
MDSPMGCGYNVMVFLQFMKWREAFEHIKQMVLSKSPGLMINGMINIIRGFPDYSTLSLRRVYLSFSDIDRRTYIEHLCKMLRDSKGVTRYNYMITKLAIDESTGLGHTAILEYDSFTDIVSSIDPQKSRRKSIEKYVSYIENKGIGYKGLSYIAIDQNKHGGERKKLNKTRKYRSKSNLKKIKSIDTYIGIMETKVKVKKKVSKRRRTKQPKYEGGSDEEFWEIMRKHGKIDHYTEFESGSRCMTDEEIALLTRIMKEEDEYFAENP